LAKGKGTSHIPSASESGGRQNNRRGSWIFGAEKGGAQGGERKTAEQNSFKNNPKKNSSHEKEKKKKGKSPRVPPLAVFPSPPGKHRKKKKGLTTPSSAKKITKNPSTRLPVKKKWSNRVPAPLKEGGGGGEAPFFVLLRKRGGSTLIYFPTRKKRKKKGPRNSTQLEERGDGSGFSATPPAWERKKDEIKSVPGKMLRERWNTLWPPRWGGKGEKKRPPRGGIHFRGSVFFFSLSAEKGGREKGDGAAAGRRGADEKKKVARRP